MPDHPAMDAIALRGLFDPESLCASQDWKPFRPGIESALIYETPGDGPAAMLLRYQPGAHAPAHRHLGFEHIVVLSGSQTDERGRHGAGSLLVHAPGTDHHVHSEDGCVVLAIWERRVGFIPDDEPTA